MSLGRSPLSREQFRDALRKGLGRALLHVRDFGIGDLRDDLLEACTQNWIYDRQCEGDRAAWYMELIDLIGEANTLTSKIVDIFIQTSDSIELGRMEEIVAMIAKRGSASAHNALLQKYETELLSCDHSEYLIDVNGISGLVHTATLIGRNLLRDNDAWADGYLVERAGELYGKEAVAKALSDAAQSSNEVRAYYAHVLARELKASECVREQQLVSSILEDINAAKRQYSSGYIGWAKRASAEELQIVFDRFLIEQRIDQLIQFLWVFRHRAMPRLDKRVLDWVRSNNSKLQDAAIGALRLVKDDSIRDLAIRMIKEDGRSAILAGALELFAASFQPGDGVRIEKELWVDNDADVNHRLTGDIRTIEKAQPSKELAPILIWVYENSPCSLCRGSAVEGLAARLSMPVWMQEECQYDSDDEIRNIGRAYNCPADSQS